MTVEETVYFDLADGKTVFVKDLDEATKKQVAIFDRLRQDVLDKTYEMQVYMSALESKKASIQNSVKEFMAKKEKENKDG